MSAPRNAIAVAYSAGPECIEVHRGVEVTHPHPRHWHDEYLVCAITGGGGYTEYRGNAHFTPPGSMFVLPPGEVHSNYSTEDGCSYANIYLPAHIVEQVLTNTGSKAFPIGPLVLFDNRVHQTLVSLCDVLEFSDSQMQRDSALLHFFDRLNHSRGHECPPRDHGHARINLVREYLDAHFDQDVGLELLAELAGMSTFHLNRIFRIHVGMPPHAYQVQRRIALAKVLLRGGWTIADVAHRTGFTDQSHLTRHFKRVVGITPGRFVPARKNVQDLGFAAD
jgi:AraC-like DNA-binding protein